MDNLELPGKHQEIKSSQILIFDPSFDDNYGLEFACGMIYGVIKNNIKRSKDLHLFFGISEHLFAILLSVPNFFPLYSQERSKQPSSQQQAKLLSFENFHN